MSFSAGSVFANWQSISSTLSDSPIFSGNGICSSDPQVIIEPGDSVDPGKWNQMACAVRDLLYLTRDGARNMTAFLGGSSNKIAGVSGYQVDEINLPTKGLLDPKVGGAIHFKDATKSYTDASGYAAGIVYGKTYSNGLDLYNFKDGVRITTGSAKDLKSYTLGWEKVNVYDTTNFDISCQYRAVTDSGWALSFNAINATTLRGQFNISANGEDNNDASIRITSNQKAVFEVFGSGGYGSKTRLNYAYGGLFIAGMEKFCLPSYNPNNY